MFHAFCPWKIVLKGLLCLQSCFANGAFVLFVSMVKIVNLAAASVLFSAQVATKDFFIACADRNLSKTASSLSTTKSASFNNCGISRWVWKRSLAIGRFRGRAVGEAERPCSAGLRRRACRGFVPILPCHFS